MCVVYLISDKAPSEATFRGLEFLWYDLSRTGGEPIASTQDSISLYFKTRQPSGLLFHTGECHTIVYCKEKMLNDKLIIYEVNKRTINIRNLK